MVRGPFYLCAVPSLRRRSRVGVGCGGGGTRHPSCNHGIQIFSLSPIEPTLSHAHLGPVRVTRVNDTEWLKLIRMGWCWIRPMLCQEAGRENGCWGSYQQCPHPLKPVTLFLGINPKDGDGRGAGEGEAARGKKVGSDLYLTVLKYLSQLCYLHSMECYGGIKTFIQSVKDIGKCL